MKANLQIDVNRAEKNLFMNRHETLPLTLYKYSPECIYKKAWNDTTLRCRGMVVDDNGEVVVNCMPKFFNHGEPEANLQKLLADGLKYVVTEKLDGSLIQATLWNGQTLVTSSGSFGSAQALYALNLLETTYAEAWKKAKVGYTYVFEL